MTLRKLRRDEGATAVEFGLIAFPLFVLILGVLEMSMLFFMGIELEHGTQQVARQIRTGQVPHGISKAEFADRVCDEVAALPDCASRLFVSVEVISDFASGTLDSPFDGTSGAFDPSAFPVEVGGPNEIVVLRTFYQWPLFTPVLSAPLANMDTGKHRLLMASQAMKNEPY